jgi:hypothetical protein
MGRVTFPNDMFGIRHTVVWRSREVLKVSENRGIVIVTDGNHRD